MSIPQDQIVQGAAEAPQVRVRVPAEQNRGVYANLVVVSHSAHEFTLDFCEVRPQGLEAGLQGEVQGDVVARVRVAPTLVESVLQALQSNVEAYEDQFGAIRRV
jgi:Protein of unknown function (DUF3467)